MNFSSNTVLVVAGVLFLIMVIDPGTNSAGDWASGLVGLAIAAAAIYYLVKNGL